MADSQQSSKPIEKKNRSKKSNQKTTIQTNLIRNYFKADSAKESNEVKSVQRAEKNDFYENCFKSQIESCEANKNCHEVKINLKRKLEISKQKEASIQESIAMCKRICKQKDDKIKSFEIETERNKQISPVTTSNNTGQQHNPTDTNKSSILFDQFNEIFAENQLSTLRSIDKSKKGDSTFILNCLRFLYSHDLAKLEHKSVTGKSKTGDPKEPITPQKLNQIQTVYVERLNDLKLERTDQDEREKKFRNHVHRAIININNAQRNAKENIKVINFE